MDVIEKLSGWNFIIYQLIENKFSNTQFSLTDIYNYESEFKKVYPANYHIKEKIRQTLQHLRDFKILTFVDKGVYRLELKNSKIENVLKDAAHGYVYLLSNESIPYWVKIGRTMNLEQRVSELYNTSVPLPFRLEDSVEVGSQDNARLLEKSIHSIIDTINPVLRKETEASRREFFKMTVEEAKKVFSLVRLINKVEITNGGI